MSKTQIGASLDEELVDSVDEYLDEELDGMNRTEYMRRTFRLGMMVRPEMLDLVAGENVSLNVAAQPTSTGDAPESSDSGADESYDYNELTLGHDRLINPDEADFTDKNVLKQTNKQRVIVLKGILAYLRSDEGDWNTPAIQKTELESLIRQTFGVASDASVNKILTLACELGVLKTHITNDPRLVDNTQSLNDDVVKILELRGYKTRAEEIDNHATTITELSGRWDSNREKLVDKWFKPDEVYYYKDDLIVWEQASEGALDVAVATMGSSPGSQRIVTRLFAIAIREDVISLEDAEELIKSQSPMSGWFASRGVESVFEVGSLEVAEQERVEERRQEREEAIERVEAIPDEINCVLDDIRDADTKPEYEKLVSNEFATLRDEHQTLVERWNLDPSLPDDIGHELTDAVQEAETRINAKERAEAEETVRSNASEMESVTGRLTDASSEFEDAIGQYDEFDGHTDEVADVVSDYRETVDNAESEFESLQSEVEDAESEFGELDVEVDVSTLVDEFEVVLDDARSLLTDAESRLEAAEERREKRRQKRFEEGVAELEDVFGRVESGEIDEEGVFVEEAKSAGAKIQTDMLDDDMVKDLSERFTRLYASFNGGSSQGNPGLF